MTDATVPNQEARQRLHEIIRKDVPFDEKAREALELGTQCLDLDCGHLVQIDELTEHWEAVITTETAPGQTSPEAEQNLSETYCRETIENDAPLALHDAPNQGWADDPAFETSESPTYLGIPLIVEEEPYGTVCFVADDPRSEPFSDTETRFAEHLTRLLEREFVREQIEGELTSQANLAAVLNRVLRHNLRNDISVVRGNIQQIAKQLPDDPTIETVFDHIDSLINLGERARELERIVTSDKERQHTAVGPLVEGVVEAVAEEHPHASLSVEYDEDISAALRPDFERAVRELLENAIEYSGEPRVSVTIDTVPNAVEIQITDNGPGLQNMEAEVLSTGEETPLSHGQGLGLWLVHWIVTSHEGSIDTTVTDNGTTITLSIPRNPGISPNQQLPDATRGRDRFQAAFEEAHDAILILNDDANIVNSNTAAETLFGLDWGELIGRSLADFTPEAFDFDAEWRDLQQTGAVRGTVILDSADGKKRTVEYSGKADIVPGEHVLVGRDITERTEREEMLTQRTQAMDKAPIGITISDPNLEDNPLRYVNEAFVEMTGYSREEVVGWNCRFLQGENTDPERVARIREAIDAQEEIAIDLRNYRKDGTEFWNHLEIAPIRNDEGEVISYIGFQQDVTQRKERERRINAIFDQTYQFTGLLDPDGTVREANETALEFVDLNREDVVGKPLWETDWWQGADTSQREIRDTINRAATGEFVREEVEIQGDGDTAIIDFSIRPITDDQDNIIMLIPEGRDITARKEREQELEALKERYETLLAAAPDPVFVADAETGELIEANEAAETLVGASSDEIVGLHFSELHPSDRPEQYRQLFEEQVETFEMRSQLPDGSQIYIETLDGEQIPVEIRVRMVSLPDGPVIYGIFRDLSRWGSTQ